MKTIIQVSRIRNLVLESMLFSGQFKAIKDYVQIIVEMSVLSSSVFLFLQGRKGLAITLGAVYFIIFFLSSLSSKYAYRIEKILGRGDKSRILIIAISFSVFLISLCGSIRFSCTLIPFTQSISFGRSVLPK